MNEEALGRWGAVAPETKEDVSRPAVGTRSRSGPFGEDKNLLPLTGFTLMAW